MLKFFINYLLNQFLNKKADYQKAVSSLESQGNHEESLKLQAGVSEVEKDLHSVQDNWESGNTGALMTFVRSWRTWNKLSALNDSLKPSWQQFLESIVFVVVVVFILRHFIFGLYHVPTGSAEPNILVGDRILGLKFPYRFKEIKRGDLVIFDKPDFVYDQSNVVNRLWQKYVGVPIPLLGLSAGPESWVKRVIGLPGDIVEGKVNDEGKTEIYLNGELLDEPYLNPYPLIAVRRSIGFFAPELGLPSAFNWRMKPVDYTYDPTKPLDQQPFYKIDQDEIIYNQFTGKPIMAIPRSPAYYDKFPPRKVPQGKLWVMGDNRKNSHDCRNWGFLDQHFITGRASRILFSIDSEESFWLFDFLKNPITFFTKKIRWPRSFRSLHPFEKVPEN